MERVRVLRRAGGRAGGRGGRAGRQAGTRRADRQTDRQTDRWTESSLSLLRATLPGLSSADTWAFRVQGCRPAKVQGDTVPEWRVGGTSK